MDHNNYAQHSESHNSDAMDAEFRCGLCNKAYSRRTLSVCVHAVRLSCD